PLASTAIAWLARGTMRTVQPSSSSTWRRAAWLASSSSMIRMPIWFTACPLGLWSEYSLWASWAAGKAVGKSSLVAVGEYKARISLDKRSEERRVGKEYTTSR